MTQMGRRFGLSHESGSGISCDENGVYVDDVPLLERSLDGAAAGQWRPRSVSAVSRDLGKQYGLPIDFGAKTGELKAIAGALNRGDLLHARIATVHLQIPIRQP